MVEQCSMVTVSGSSNDTEGITAAANKGHSARKEPTVAFMAML